MLPQLVIAPRNMCLLSMCERVRHEPLNIALKCAHV